MINTCLLVCTISWKCLLKGCHYNVLENAGVFLPDLCERQRSNPRRAMIELMSSGDAAPGPVTSEDTHAAPGPVGSEVNAEAPAPF